MNHTNNDCLIIVGMTHGAPGMLFAKDSDFQVKELWKPFVGDNWPSLIGKLKLIFLQACRGAKLDRRSMARMTRKMSDAHHFFHSNIGRCFNNVVCNILR
jgi:caspase 7